MPTCNVRPLGNRVVVKPDVQEKTAGGIHLPDSARDKARSGKVVGAGPGALYDHTAGESHKPIYKPMSVKVGDRVLYSRYAASDSKDVDELAGHVIVDVDSILGVIEKE